MRARTAHRSLALAVLLATLHASPGAGVAGAGPLVKVRSLALAPAPRTDGTASPTASAAVNVTTIYDNTVTAGPDWYAAQAGAEAIDDLHATASGSVTSVRFRYHEPNAASAPFTATVRFYTNPGGGDATLTAVGPAFTVSDLAAGSGLVTLPITGGPVVGPHLWMGVQFSSPTAGLRLAGPPAAGSSHDLFVESGGFYNFGGSPAANFALRVDVNSSATGVEPGVAPALVLAPVHPNPVRAGATLDWSLARAGDASLLVLDAAGRVRRTLASGPAAAGPHRTVWDGRDDAGARLAAGRYWVQLRAEGGTRSRPLAFVR